MRNCWIANTFIQQIRNKISFPKNIFQIYEAAKLRVPEIYDGIRMAPTDIHRQYVRIILMNLLSSDVTAGF